MVGSSGRHSPRGTASGIPMDGRGTVVTVGTFDGVHRGHWEVLQEIRRRAAAAERRAVLVTFHPHPLQVVNPDIAPLLLTTPDEKKEILAESGLDYALFLRFTPELSRYSPERFVEEVLVGKLGVRELVIGYDHGFGRGRSGDVATLEALGRALGFDVDVVGAVASSEEPVSSSRIRAAVAEADLDRAREGLGRPYSARGVVVRGDGRGSGLGFPTANLRIGHPTKLLPPPGVYAVRAVLPGGPVDGALHLGPRPTFQGSSSTLEVHLIDFEGDLYGAELRVDFVKRLRGIEAFGSVQALVRQMEADVRSARRVLSTP